LAWVSGPPTFSLPLALLVRSEISKRLAANARETKIPRNVTDAASCAGGKIGTKSLSERKNVATYFLLPTPITYSLKLIIIN
jgi:hypothetical protein